MKTLIVTGRLSPKTGGPLATIGNLSEVLSRDGNESHVLALAGMANATVPIPGEPESRIHSSYRTFVPDLWRSIANADLVVTVGVWHPAFALATLGLAFRRHQKLVLVPTNSLMPWDWKKHAPIKTALKPLLWLISKRFDALVCASTGELNQSRPRGGFRRGLAIPHAVNVPELGVQSEPRRPVVTYAGRLEPQKDIDLLIEVASRLAPGITLEVCGDGDVDFVASMHEKAKKLSAPIAWIGWLPRREVLERMQSSAAVVVTSKAENFCHTAAEAASLGTPVVIVDRIASASDLARSPMIDAAPAEPVAFADAVNRRVSLPPSAVEIDRARNWATKEWSLESYARRWNDLLRTVLPVAPTPANVVTK